MSVSIRYPDFLIIGAQKSGTSWLNRELGAHPEVFTPRTKELHFFDNGKARWRPTKRMTRKYASWFEAAPCEAKCGEATPSYLVNPYAPSRIHTLLPDARLIAMLRHPAERAYSQWRMLTSKGQLDPDLAFASAFHRGLPTGRSMRSRGRYAEQLERYQALFRPDQLNVLLYDDLIADPLAVMRRSYRFLGVADDFSSETVMDRHPTSYSDYDGVPHEISPSDRSGLIEYYEPSITRLEELLDRDLDCWRS